MRLMNPLKKKAALFYLVGMVSLAGTSCTYAASVSESYLRQIMINTAGILKQVNNLPHYLQGLGKYIISWMKEDNTKTTAQMQASFASLGAIITQDQSQQLNQQLQLTADLFGFDKSKFTPQGTDILKLLPNINDLTYSTMLGMPPIKKAPQVGIAPYNYIKNAGGLTLSHVQPILTWQGKPDDLTKYINYYNTMMAIESYNGYILSEQYAESQNGNAFSSIQNALLAQASNSSWIAQIATEELGKVLRQILMFQSQSYLVLSELLKTEKQMLKAQVMTNALLILNNQNSENLLVAKAQGVQAS